MIIANEIKLKVNLYISDKHEYLDNETELIQYADDTIVLTSNTSIKDAKILERKHKNYLLFSNQVS